MEPVRTCLGCRQRADISALLRVVASGGEVLPDPSAALPGRGAWVHPETQCVETAIKRRAFGRALRVIEALDTGRLVAGVTQRSAPQERPNEQAD